MIHKFLLPFLYTAALKGLSSVARITGFRGVKMVVFATERLERLLLRRGNFGGGFCSNRFFFRRRLICFF